MKLLEALSGMLLLVGLAAAGGSATRPHVIPLSGSTLNTDVKTYAVPHRPQVCYKDWSRVAAGLSMQLQSL